MKKYLIALFGVALLATTIGCANGPLQQCRRGAPCNTCNPQIQQPQNVAPSCDSGCAENSNAVGTGFMGRWFRGNGQQQAGSCSTGNCNALPPPASGTGFANDIQGTNAPGMIDSAPTATAPGSGLYGNSSNSVGRLEMPPINFDNN